MHKCNLNDCHPFWTPVFLTSLFINWCFSWTVLFVLPIVIPNSAINYSSIFMAVCYVAQRTRNASLMWFNLIVNIFCNPYAVYDKLSNCTMSDVAKMWSKLGCKEADSFLIPWIYSCQPQKDNCDYAVICLWWDILIEAKTQYILGTWAPNEPLLWLHFIIDILSISQYQYHTIVLFHAHYC